MLEYFLELVSIQVIDIFHEKSVSVVIEYIPESGGVSSSLFLVQDAGK